MVGPGFFEAFDRPVPYLIEISAGETKEYCLALFLFVYLLGLAIDLRHVACAEPAASGASVPARPG